MSRSSSSTTIHQTTPPRSRIGLLLEDPRIVVVHNKQNLGHVRAFNRGLERAIGEFLVRLAPPTSSTPGCLARAVDLFDYAPNLLVSSTATLTISSPPALLRRAPANLAGPSGRGQSGWPSGAGSA